MLAKELDSAQREFNSKRFFVDRFEETRPKVAMDADRGGDDLIRDF
jgi:hypothetical protein